MNIISKTIAVVHSIYIKLSDASAKCFKNPLQNFFTVVRDFQNAMVIGISITSAIGCVDVMANEKTAFSVNKSGQISKIQRCNIRKIVGFKFRHENPFVKNACSLNERDNFCHAERLNKATFHQEKMRKSELCGNTERKIRRGFPAVDIQSVGMSMPKVTECLNEAARLLAQNLGQTMDEVTRDVLASTSSVLQCSHGGNGNTPTQLTYEDICAAVGTLLGNDAEMISEVVTAGPNFSTTAIRPAFWGFIDTDLLCDLENVGDMFVPTAQYASQQTVLEAEWGATGNVRWLYTSVGSVSTANPAVYNNFIVGKEAYGVVHLGAETGDFYIKPLGSAGSADPLDQRGTVGEMSAHYKFSLIDLELLEAA